MRISVLDKCSLGNDLPFEMLRKYGEINIFDSTDSSQLTERIKESDVIIINKIKITESILSDKGRLSLICVFATGYDNIDLDAARKHGVAVCNVPSYSTDSVVLFTLSTVLALSSRLFEYASFVKSGEYSKSAAPNKITPVFNEIRGKLWGIIGYGNIGRAVADIAKSLGARIMVCKRTPTPDIQNVDVDTICKECDIITVHCPLNDTTHHLINERRLAFMKKNVILVNEARGAVLDEQAVANAVLNGQISGFGCDVYSTEPFDCAHPYNKILNFNNVILTPHAAWAAYESRMRCLNIISDNISTFITGGRLNRVD